MTTASTITDDQSNSVWQMTVNSSIRRCRDLFTFPHGRYTTAGVILFVLIACFTSFYSILSCTFVIVTYKEILEDDVFTNIYEYNSVGAGIFTWLKPNDGNEDTEWNDGTCTRYSGSEQETVIDGTLRFTRFIGVWVLMFGLAVLCYSISLSCRPVISILQVQLLKGVYFMLFASMLILFLVKRSSICHNIGQESECTLGSGGLVAIAGSAMWLTAFILASAFLKVTDDDISTSRSKSDTKSKATERSGSQQSTIRTDLKTNDEFLQQTRSNKITSPKNKSKKNQVLDEKSGNLFKDIETDSQKAVATDTLDSIKEEANANITGLPRSRTLQRILSLGQKVIQPNTKEEEGIEVDTIPEEIFQKKKKSKSDYYYEDEQQHQKIKQHHHQQQQQQYPQEIATFDNDIIGNNRYDERFDDVNLDDNIIVDIEQGFSYRHAAGSRNMEFDTTQLIHPKNPIERYTDEHRADDYDKNVNDNERRASRGADRRADNEVRRSSKSKERIRNKHRKISPRTYGTSGKPRSTKYSGTLRGTPSSDNFMFQNTTTNNGYDYDNNRSDVQNSHGETHSAYVRRSEASILGKANSIIASQAADGDIDGNDTMEYREPQQTDSDYTRINNAAEEFRDDIVDDSSIVDDNYKRRRRRDRRQRRRLSKRRESSYHQVQNDSRVNLDENPYLSLSDNEEDNLSAACTNTVCSVVDLTIDRFD